MSCNPTKGGRRGDYAEEFARGLMDPSIAAPADVKAGSMRGVTARYNVYRNNVIVSLIDALASIYPAVARITGSEFFRAMARFHIRATPPKSPVLSEYGYDFPSFIERYEYAQQMPWLVDVARIERAWLDAYHAADLPVLSADALANIGESALGGLRFVPHPAARVLRSAYPVVAIFVMNRQDGPVVPLESSEAEDTLITRPRDEVMVSRLPSGGAAFLSSLIAGHSLIEAISLAFDEAPSFDLQGNLAGVHSAGVFSALRYGD
jgi:hypothetical protein